MERKIILDTNVWISFFLGGKFYNLTKLILENKLEVQTCSFLIDELKDVLSRDKISKYLKYPLSEYLNFHFQMTNLAQMQRNFSGSPDPDDDFLFDLAQQSGAKYLITGDKKLLKFHFDNLEIISLTNFTDMFSVK